MNSSLRKQSGGKPSRAISGPAWAGAIAILVLGVILGYLFSRTTSPAKSASVDQAVQSNGTTGNAQSQASFEAGMRTLLDRLQSHPNDPALLADVGNRYFDHQEWSKAVQYYRRLLRVQPSNVNVRTDMGTAIWYGGDPWNAIHEYKTALAYEPNHPQTLFNLGVVQWKGAHDDRAALKSWQRLLRLHPDYSDRQKVKRYMQQVQGEVNQQGIPSGSIH